MISDAAFSCSIFLCHIMYLNREWYVKPVVFGCCFYQHQLICMLELARYARLINLMWTLELRWFLLLNLHCFSACLIHEGPWPQSCVSTKPTPYFFGATARSHSSVLPFNSRPVIDHYSNSNRSHSVHLHIHYSLVLWVLFLLCFMSLNFAVMHFPCQRWQRWKRVITFT